jgi:ligand-binding SRPBCC domain-containing protein
VRCFRLETTIAAPPAACFELSLSVDAHATSMSGSGESAVAGVTSGSLVLGDTVTWRARHFGIAFRMTAAITAYEHPHRFVDEQVHGPFATWRHEHTFTALPSGDTLMADDVRFRAPFGPVGTLAEQLVLTAHLTRLLQRRNTWLKNELEHPPTQ